MRNTRSNVPCPNNCGCRWWNREFDTTNSDLANGKWVWVWKCRNCSLTQPIVTHGHARHQTEFGMVTRAQERILKRLRDAIMAFDNVLGNYEMKRFEVKISESGTASLVAETGRKGDEGTAMELFRTIRHLFVGPNGCVSCYEKDSKVVRGLKNCLAVTV
jgi:hypothetical protein